MELLIRIFQQNPGGVRKWRPLGYSKMDTPRVVPRSMKILTYKAWFLNILL